MKKYLLMLMIFIMVFTFTGCKSNTSRDNSIETSKDYIQYENDTYNFSLQLPKSWEGKYYIEEGNNEVYFYHKNDLDDGRKVELFTLHISNTKEEWEELQKQYEDICLIDKIYEDEQGIISITYPTDVPYGDDEKEYYEEYNKMEDDISNIQKSIDRIK
ncbi:MAG: Lipoprotein [Sporanaerobacter sp.]|jgi:hypothetical protein|uniref:hypothetical protein n=1 Tax=Sporanaerobacter sp. TaxID=2010183 RepID=UPI003A102653